LASFFFRTFPGWYVSSPNWGAATTAIFNYFKETSSKSIALLSGSTQLTRASQDISIFDLGFSIWDCKEYPKISAWQLLHTLPGM
jgi:hypothetical protein